MKIGIPKIINKCIKKWFCNHIYELGKKLTINWTDTGRESIIEVYYCTKCKKIHSMCSSLRDLLKEEIKREEFLVRNEINKQLKK